MRVYRCDRCGNVYDTDALPEYHTEISVPYRSGVSVDLCPQCVHELDKFIYTAYYLAAEERKHPDCKDIYENIRKELNK